MVQTISENPLSYDTALYIYVLYSLIHLLAVLSSSYMAYSLLLSQQVQPFRLFPTLSAKTWAQCHHDYVFEQKYTVLWLVLKLHIRYLTHN